MPADDAAKDARVAELEADLARYAIFEGDPDSFVEGYKEFEAEAARLRAALERIGQQQPKVLAYIRKHGFVFDDIGVEPGNWKHLAFSIYSDLCEVDVIAREALAGGGQQ